MAPKRKATIPTKVLVVDTQPPQPEKGEDTPLAKTFGSKKVLKKTPKEGASREPGQSSKAAKKTAERVSVKLPKAKEAGQKDGSTCDVPPKERTRKQPARSLVDEPEEGDPEGKVNPAAFEATFDSGNSPNEGDEPETAEGEKERSEETEELEEEDGEGEMDTQ